MRTIITTTGEDVCSYQIPKSLHRNTNLAQSFEKPMILKYYAEPMGATTYLKILGFPNAYTIFYVSM